MVKFLRCITLFFVAILVQFPNLIPAQELPATATEPAVAGVLVLARSLAERQTAIAEPRPGIVLEIDSTSNFFWGP